MITLYNENDQRITDIHIYEINDAEMGESTITATVKFDQVMQFHPDWYIILDGEKYKLGITGPAGKRETAQIRVEYTLIFHSSREDLKRYTFMNFVEYGQDNPQPYQHTFSLYGCTLQQLVGRFNANLQYYLGSTWAMILSPDADPNVTADLSFDKASLWDVLLDFYENYGVRWVVRSDDGVMNIVVGEDATELQTIFEYGNGNGLISVERTNPTERIITRLRGKGGTKNLPANYFHAATSAFPIADPDTNSILQTVFYDRLYPKNYREYVRGYNSGQPQTGSTWAYQQGVADKVAGRPMNIIDFARSNNEDFWGISYGAIADNDEIFPTLQGATRDGVELDRVLQVSQVYVDAPEEEGAAQKFNQVEGAKGSFQGRDYRISINGKDGGIQYVVGNDHAMSATAESGRFTLSSAINTVKAKLLVSPTKYADYYAVSTGSATDPVSPTLITLEEMSDSGWLFMETIDLVNALSGTTVRSWSDTDVDFFDVQADDIPAGSYKFRVTLRWYKMSSVNPDKLLYTMDWQLYGCEFATYMSAAEKMDFSETFDIWIGNVWNTSKLLGETDEDYAYRVWSPLVSSEEMTVMFSDGLLAGEDYEFPIVGAVANADDLELVIKRAIHYDTSVTGSHWRLTLRKSDAEFEASGKYLPNSVVNAVAGNHFFFTNILMPYDPYVYDAERRLQEYLEDQLSLLDVELPTFSVVPSSVFMGAFDEVDDVKPGNKIRLRDLALIGSSYTTLYIQSVSKKYTASKINPGWSIVVSDQIVVNGNPISLVEGKVEALSRQMYSSKQATRDAIEAFAQFYLRKDGLADASFSRTDFRAPVTIRDNFTDYDFRQNDFSGKGFGVYTDPDGNRVVEADVLVGRMALRVNEIIVNQTEYVGGQKIYSPAAMTVSRVEDTGTAWRCYFDNKQGTERNLFVVGDMGFCQHFKGTETGGYTTYWAKVTAIGSDYIELSKTDKMQGGSGSPEPGDNIIQLGNSSDADRQSAIVLSSYGDNSPSIKLYHGITGYTLSNKDMFGVEYDSVNQIPYLYNYGSMRLGSRPTDENGSYITYNHISGALNVKAIVNFMAGSTGLSNMTEWTQLQQQVGQIDAAADAAQQAAYHANLRMNAWLNDGVFSKAELRDIRNELEYVDSDYAEIRANALKYGVSITNFTGAYNTYEEDLENILSGEGEYEPDTDGNVPVPDNFATHQTDYYIERTKALNATATAIKNRISALETSVDDVQYLTEAFSESTSFVSGGLFLGSFIGVSDSAIATQGQVVAGMNGSDIGLDSEHGKLMFFAGTPEAEAGVATTYDERVRLSAARIYSDGHIEANDLNINKGHIGGFDILADGIYYGDSSSPSSLRITTSNCYLPNAQINGSIMTRLKGTGDQNFIVLSTSNGTPIVRMNAMSLSTASIPTYLFLSNGTTILNASPSGWWSSLTINYWYNMLANVYPTAAGTLSVPAFNLYYNAGRVEENFQLKVAVVKFSGQTEVDRYVYFTSQSLGNGESTVQVPQLASYAVDSYYTYGVYVYVGGKLKNGMNNAAYVNITTDDSTHAAITYSGGTDTNKGVFIGANGINVNMGAYSKFQYIVPGVTFSNGDVSSDLRARGGNFEVSLKAQGNDSVGVRIVGHYDSNNALSSDGAMIYMNLGRGGGWKKLSVTSDGTLKLT